MPVPKSLILHAGLPKTGSTALQRWCQQNRDGLLAAGIDYPDEWVSTADPKHQFLVEALRSGAFERVAHVLRQHDTASTLILSSEGLTNQFQHFDDEHLERFRQLLAGWAVTVFLVRREQNAWTRSYYRQCLINPRFSGHPYGTTLSLDEFAALEEVQSLYELADRPHKVSVGFGAHLVAVADYDRDWFRAWLRLIGLPAGSTTPLPARANDSPPDPAMDAILAINRHGVSDPVRSCLLFALGRVIGTANTVLRDYYQPSTEPAVVQASLAALNALLDNTGLDRAMLQQVIEFVDHGSDLGRSRT